MTHIQHTISLRNLPVASDTCRNVPPIVRWLDDKICLLGPGVSLEQLSESGHRWKIVFHPNALWVSQTHESRGVPNRDCTVVSCYQTFYLLSKTTKQILYCACHVRSCIVIQEDKTMPLLIFTCLQQSSLFEWNCYHWKPWNWTIVCISFGLVSQCCHS